MIQETKKGRIIKGVGGFYTVRFEDGTDCVCKARGLFRKKDITPLVGDIVEIEINPRGSRMDGRAAEGASQTGYISAIMPRKNELIRPAVANIDRLFAVISATRPRPDLLLIDKLMLAAEKYGVEPVLVINKCDGASAGEIAQLKAEYEKTGYRMFAVSAETHEGLDELKKLFLDAVVCFAGQSAVGKSSLLNALIPDIDLAVGGLSEKTERGRHTTRHTQLIPLDGCGAVLDTPGFSFFEAPEIDESEIRFLYPELRGLAENCRFTACLHISEPDCAVKAAMSGDAPPMHKNRYERYVRLVNEAKERRRHKYD
ncbi:MAG: ribosome small subunit-dependent GTPase A [Clostridia bacterium]|nr:ribosome small subunit-dependent GTPase A [Clostridia bacterium]